MHNILIQCHSQRLCDAWHQQTWCLQLTDGNLSALLRAYNGSIASVHEDSEVATAQLQGDAPWSLDRLDQARLPLDQQFHYNNLGTGVNAYIVDTVMLCFSPCWFTLHPCR